MWQRTQKRAVSGFSHWHFGQIIACSAKEKSRSVYRKVGNLPAPANPEMAGAIVVSADHRLDSRVLRLCDQIKLATERTSENCEERGVHELPQGLSAV